MNVKLPDDQTLWFRNLPLKASDEGSEEVQDSAEKAPEVELFIEPLTGLAISMSNTDDLVFSDWLHLQHVQHFALRDLDLQYVTVVIGLRKRFMRF